MDIRSRAARVLAGERGMALITGILVLLLASSLLAGFLTVVTADSKLRGVDRSRTQSFYAAYAGLEKLTADLGNVFLVDYSPEPAEINTLKNQPPAIEDVQFVAADGLGYNITFTPDASGDPLAEVRTISSGPFEGLRGLVTRYTLTTTARMPDNAESRVTRDVNTVGIPVFQFGVFSETDLTFSANDTFTFGGRVHTNGNLWLTAASGGATTLSDRTTVVKEVVRTHLANGRLNDGTHEGTVNVAKGLGVTRVLAESEGSVVNNVTSALNDPLWTNLSIGTYNGYIRNGRTGAKALNLGFVSLGAKPIDLITRPVIGENPLITDQRLFTQASVRILLSDTAAQINNLPGVSPGATALTGAVFNGIPVGRTTNPVQGTAANNIGLRAPTNTSVQSGFIKIEYRNAAGAWIDVTSEWLNLGFTKRNIDAMTTSNATQCTWDPGSPGALSDPRAIIRLQRVRGSLASGTQVAPLAPLNPPCGTTGVTGTSGSVIGKGLSSATATEYWPLTLYDVREAWSRDNLSTSNADLYLGGVMHYIELDVNNLRRWLAGQIGASGVNAVNEDGYAIYFSDRRNNRNTSGVETGEYGSEDMVNPGDVNGTPNNIKDSGEDLNDNNVLDIYGANSVTPAGAGALTTWIAPQNNTANRRTVLNAACRSGVASCPNDTAMNKARLNPAILFRRALKVSNGTLGNLPTSGLTIASENPVYVEGHYNANTAGFGANAPAAIMADSITLLSENWKTPLQVKDAGGNNIWLAHGDTRSFNDPNDPASRPAGSTRYRFAALAGKIKAFTQLNTPASFGTDGGVHNFLRLTEDWGDVQLYYMGSLASFFHSRQNVGLFRCCNNVYMLPGRNFQFDVNFLTPGLLPPKTPMFRDVNTTRFRHVTR